jgi:transposase
MAPTTLNRLVLLMSSLVLAVGVIDGIASREWDFLTVFAAALALQLLLLARLSVRRPAVPIRRDLVAWLRDEAALRGEPMEAVADRAISSYQAGFSDLGDPPPVPRAGRSRRPEPATPREPVEQDPGP